MSRGWVEIWTRPGSATFEAVIVDPPIQSASFTRALSGIGRGELVLPADYARIDEIILTDLATPANNVRTLVRVFFDDGTATPVVAYEFYADQLERVEGPDNLVSITGPGVESSMGDARVEPYDWDGTANFTSEFPDWVWGGIDVMRSVSVAGLARVPDVWEIGTDGTGGTFTLTLNGNPTANIAYNATTNQLEGAVQATDLGNVDAIVDGGEGTIDQPWRLAINLPVDGNTLTADFTGVTGDTEQVFQKVQTGGYDGANVDGWTVSQFADGRATPQLFGTYEFPPLRVVTTGLPAGTTYGIEVRGASQFAGIQKVMNVTSGGLYHSRLVFRTPSAIDEFRAVVRDPVADGEATPIAKFPANASSFVPGANVLYQIDMDGIVIPEGVNQIIDRLAYVGTGDPQTFTLYPELSFFREGQPPTTVGDIMIQLLEDADGTNHPAREVWRNTADTLTWVDYSSFTDALDSNGDAWTDADLSVTVKRGKPYDKVLADFVGLGYEWELIPDTVTPGVWLLNVYNSDGIGTDRTALDTPQIFGEESVGGARMYRRHPPASNVAVEGSSQLSARISSVGAVTAYGLRETYVPDLDITTLADASLKATQTISAYLRKSQPLTLARQPRDVDPFPFVAYQLGDTVNVSEPPFMEKDGRRLVQVVWALTADGETVSESFGAVTYTGQAAVNQGVFQLLDRFEPIREVDAFQPVQAGGGGVVPWLVAASNAPEGWKSVAGYVCLGVDDQEVINAALATEQSVVLSPGFFYIRSNPSGYAIDLEPGTSQSLVGSGSEATLLLVSESSTFAAIRVHTASRVADFALYASGATTTPGIVVSGAYTRVENIHVKDLEYGVYAGIGLAYGSILNCSFQNMGVHAIQIVECESFVVAANVIRGCDQDGIYIAGGAHNTITGNTLYEVCTDQAGDAGIRVGDRPSSVSEALNITITGNTIHSNDEGIAVDCTTSNIGVSITGNTIQCYLDGIRLSNVTDSVIASNTVRGIYSGISSEYELDGPGILVAGSSRNLVDGNVVSEPGAFTSNTFDGIILSGDSNGNKVSGNVVVPRSSGNTTRYGINVSAAACDDNVVADNFLGDASVYGTGSYNDAGTGTLTARDANGQFTY